MSRHLSENRTIACHGCDLLLAARSLAAGERAGCPRCGEPLSCGRGDTVDRSLAFTLAALIAFVPANALPFMTLSIGGREQGSTLASGVFELFQQGLWALAALVFVASVGAPLARLSVQALVLGCVRMQRAGSGVARLFRWSRLLGPWSMLEVYLLGVLVAVVKLAGMAELGLGFGFYAFLALMLLSTAAISVLDPHDVWERIEVQR